MRINNRGQVTIPREIREQLGLLPGTEVEWEVRGSEAVLRKVSKRDDLRGRALIEHMRGRGTVRMSTDEIIALTR
ncbi:MAG TPA: AbrB/MazE/SpoVT family DNA-binding domain-containing protein [Longimicrobium sp.]|uniref:AbrB/MazE/SpoVT family DNA-binding domain-containing protein n=1 Tax=Longimicrobium sp. TaxID=2029185 RepID=UPI002ED7B0B5